MRFFPRETRLPTCDSTLGPFAFFVAYTFTLIQFSLDFLGCHTEIGISSLCLQIPAIWSKLVQPRRFLLLFFSILGWMIITERHWKMLSRDLKLCCRCFVGNWHIVLGGEKEERLQNKLWLLKSFHCFSTSEWELGLVQQMPVYAAEFSPVNKRCCQRAGFKGSLIR